MCSNCQTKQTISTFFTEICPKFFKFNIHKINTFWCQIFKNVSADSKSALSRYHMCKFSGKTDNFHFFRPNWPENGFRVENQEKKSWNKNQHPRNTSFQAKRIILTFSAQIYPKMDFGVGISKSNSRSRISTSKMLRVLSFSKGRQP